VQRVNELVESVAMTFVFVSVERAMSQVVVLAQKRLKFLTECFPAHAARNDRHEADAITSRSVCGVFQPVTKPARSDRWPAVVRYACLGSSMRTFHVCLQKMQ
jgi:hypothetical protein